MLPVQRKPIERPWPQHKVLFMTSFVVGILALSAFGASCIFKGVSYLPWKYTKGLERIYGLFALCLQALSLFFGCGAVFVAGLAALSYKCSHRKRTIPR